MKEKNDNRIEFLQYPENVRKRTGMYLGSVQKDGVNVSLREVVDNSSDEVGSGYGSVVHVSTNLNGFNYVADDGRGIPISMSPDVPEKTQADLAISELHSSGKFKTGAIGRVGINGVGEACVVAVSEIFALLVRVSENNRHGSIPDVEKAWNSIGPRQKNELYYVVVYKKGYKAFESCLLLKDIEKKLFGRNYDQPIPRGMSTIALFKLDPEIFEGSVIPDIPYINLNYFLLIQQRFFGRKKIGVLIDGEPLKCTFKPFKYEIATTINPKDPDSPNKEVGVYLTFEADPELGRTDKDMFASVNGLDCKVGYHVNLAKSLLKAAIKNQYKISHDYALEGMRLGIIVLSNENVFSSQTKENLRSITKVKIDDFSPIIKEIEKVFRKNSDYWNVHFEKVNQFWDAHRNIGALEKAQKMMDSSTGSSFYRNRSNLVEGFSDATCSDRTKCSLYLTEGLSPCGSLKSGRRTINGSLTEGICPLRGKVLNVSDVDIDKALENKEISTIFSILGVGIQEKNVTTGSKSWEEAHERLKKYSRYSKIVISCDADSDGQQITMLLLYLFAKYARFLIEHGYIYICVSPLFEQGGKFFYPGDPTDPNGIPIGIDTNKSYRRFKGLTKTSPSI